MITQEHLEHWLAQMTRQLEAAEDEINAGKVQMDVINVGKTGESVVSFKYLREKIGTAKSFIPCIQDDVIRDGA